ncbi:MAG: glycosyltransferase family 4 protein [Chloroflexota bacterium]
MERRLSAAQPAGAAARRRPVAMLVHAYYDEDPRVRREAESLVAAGRPVDVFGLRRDGDAARGQLDGVAVHRLDVRRHQGAGIGTYLREYVAFTLRASWALAKAHRHRRYALVQVHTPPDALVFAALPLRLVGVPILLDLHEAMPEFFRSRFPRASNPAVHRLLLLMERASIRLATRAVTVNQAMVDRLIELDVPPEKVGVLANSPSLARFDAARFDRRTFAEDGIIRLVYAGALTPTYEVDVVIDGMAALHAARPELRLAFDVYGRGDAAAALAARAVDVGLGEDITFHGRIPIEYVPAAIAGADIGIAPTRRDPFTDVSLSTKVFEYAAMGKPVVASRLPMVERTFPAGTVRTYEPGDALALAAQIEAIVDDPLAREAAVERTAAIVQRASWEREASAYVALVDRLAASRDPS